MKPDANTPKSTITIQGLEFEVATPFAEGHTLNAAEASVLNQTRLENVRNNFAATIKKAKEEYRKANGLAEDADVDSDLLNVEDLRAKLVELDMEYEFGVRRVGGGPALSPVEKEARKIARVLVSDALKQKNIKLSSVSSEKMEELVTTVAAREDVLKEADKRVKSINKITLDEIPLADAA